MSKLTEEQAQFFTDWFMKSMYNPYAINHAIYDESLAEVQAKTEARIKKAARARKFVNNKRARIGMRPLPDDWSDHDVIQHAEFDYHWKDEG